MAGTGIVRNAQGSATARPFVSSALSTEQRRGRRNKGVFGRGVRQRRLSPCTVAQSDRYWALAQVNGRCAVPLYREPREDKFEQALRNEGGRRPGVYQPAPTSEGLSSVQQSITSGPAQKAPAFGFPQAETRTPAPSHHQDAETLRQTPDVAISSTSSSYCSSHAHVPDLFRAIHCNRFRRLPLACTVRVAVYDLESDITARRNCLAIQSASCQDEPDRWVLKMFMEIKNGLNVWVSIECLLLLIP